MSFDPKNISEIDKRARENGSECRSVSEVGLGFLGFIRRGGLGRWDEGGS